jgi:hypothetical protein
MREAYGPPVGGVFEPDKEGPVGDVTQDPFGHGQGEAGLARAARARERQEAPACEEADDPFDLLLAAHERGRLDRQVVGPRIERAKGREVSGQALDHQLPEALGGRQVLEPMLPQVAEGDLGGQVGGAQDTGGLREEDLAPVASGGDACGAMDVQAHVIVAPEPPVPRVEAHADAHLRTLRPGFGCQRALCLDRRPQPGRRGGEDGEEPVALGVDLDAAVRLDGRAKERRMTLHQRCVPVAELGDQARRTLDVGEEEGEGPRGEGSTRER